MATEMVHVTQAKNVKSEEEEPKETALWDSEHVAFLPSKHVERLQIKIAHTSGRYFRNIPTFSFLRNSNDYQFIFSGMKISPLQLQLLEVANTK